MGKETGFLEYGRQDPGYRPVGERLQDYHAVERNLPEAELYHQAARCMNCGIPFCHAHGCPLSNVIPEFNDHVYHQRWREALEVLLETNPFPEFTGRICPAPCETSCVLGINDDAVTIRQIELAIAEAGFEKGLIVPHPPQARREERVAIVGSGPAGLSAANALNRNGFRVVVYENAQKPGGILRYGIPDFKLEKNIVDRRVHLMEAEGIVFETRVEIGRDISHRYLRSRFDAVILTGGAREPRDLAVPGRELDGIHFAMPFLVQQNRRLGGEPIEPGTEIIADGLHVVVLGGGDTGSDCLGTSLRQGAKSVTQIEILPEPPSLRYASTPWPMWPRLRRDSSSHKEGGRRHWSACVEAFSGEEGHVCGVQGVEVEWAVDEKSGRSEPHPKEGSAFRLQADLVLLSMGFVGPGRNALVEQLGIELNPRGFVRRDANGMTSEEGIFVAGDMSQGASLVVRAIEDGKQIAEGVARYLDERSQG